jgi:hypothetical protein
MFDSTLQFICALQTFVSKPVTKITIKCFIYSESKVSGLALGPHPAPDAVGTSGISWV